MQRNSRSKETKWLSVVTQHVSTWHAVWPWHIMALDSCLWLAPYLVPSPFVAFCLIQTWPSEPMFAPNPQTLWDSCLHLAPSFALSNNPTHDSLLPDNQSHTQPRLPALCCTAWALLSCWAHRREDFPGYFAEGSPHVPVLQLEWFAKNPLAVHNMGWCAIHELQMKPRGEGAGRLEIIPGW